MKSVLIYAFDYLNSEKLSLQSAVNDVHLVWTLAISKYQLVPEDIMIIGSIDLKGKMIPWRKRCFFDLDYDYHLVVENFLKDTTQLLLYFTGHGNHEGLFLYGSDERQKSIAELVPERFLLSSDKYKTWIIADICYSHLFVKDYLESLPIFIPSSFEHPVALSTQRGSIFTINIVRKLMHESDTIFIWLREEQYCYRDWYTLPFS